MSEAWPVGSGASPGDMIRTSVISVVLALGLFGCGRDGVNGELLEDGGVATGGNTGMNTGGGAGANTGGSTGTTGGGSGATGGGAGSTGGGNGGAVTFCEVQPVVQAQCGACHGVNPVSGAPRLTTAAELSASSPAGGTMLDRSITRMETQPVSAAMPPNLGGAPSDIALFKAWRANALAPCNPNTGGGGGSNTGGGSGATGGGSGTTGGGTGATGGGGGSGPVMTTCASNLTWQVTHASPGFIAPPPLSPKLHTMKHKGPLEGFMGTVYPALHEAPLCMVSTVPSGVTVEILDMAGTVRRTFTISAFSDGNFHGGTVGSPSPYRARVKLNGVVKSEMLTAQTNGDCNSCHTAQGAQGAPGRIHW